MLQLPELLRKSLGGGFGDQLMKLTESQRLLPEMIEDNDLVFSADNPEGGFHRTFVVAVAVFVHEDSLI